ncbi:uncharacterized protein LOC108114800 isoform X2 [Drosophila eugracilis]|nr:uncharacterized protein LOC108114800 isoform X2 [Drosophila eugracilis]
MQQQPQQGGDFDRGSSQMSTYQPPPAPVQDRYHHGTADMYDGLQAGSYSPGRYQCSSPSEYRCMMKEQKRAKEMMSRNGLYSPMETSARYSGGDANYYSNYAESNRQSRPGGGNSYW